MPVVTTLRPLCCSDCHALIVSHACINVVKADVWCMGCNCKKYCGSCTSAQIYQFASTRQHLVQKFRRPHLHERLWSESLDIHAVLCILIRNHLLSQACGFTRSHQRSKCSFEFSLHYNNGVNLCGPGLAFTAS